MKGDAADQDRRAVTLSRRQATALFEGAVMLQAYIATHRSARKYPYDFDDVDRAKRAISDTFGKAVDLHV